jgi:hypothetical protein
VSELKSAPEESLLPPDGGGERSRAEHETGARLKLGQPIGWLRPRWIWLAGVLLVGAQTWWMSSLLSHSYFKLDDFYYVERAASNGLTWKYLMWVNGGKLTPVGDVIAWALTRISPYNWTLISAVTLVLLAAAGLALLRMLRTLFGDQPGIVLLLAVYLLSPLTFPGLSWWAVVLEVLPLEIAMFCAVTAHVRYLRTGRRRHLAAATGWLLLGMLASEKGIAVPLLLLAVTSAFLTTGSWPRAVKTTLRNHRRAWSAYAAVMIAYAAVYLVQLHAYGQASGNPGAAGGVFEFVATMIRNTFVPGMLGGPWHWFAVGDYGVASPPAPLSWIALAVAAAVVLVSIWGRLSAWRAWAILAGWIIVVDCLPVLLGRGGILPIGLLGQETRYVMEDPGIAALIIGLAFLPVPETTAATPQDHLGRASLSMGRPATAAVAGVATALFIGSLWSFHAYVNNTTSAPTRSYLANARLALADAPAGTFIVDAQVPTDVLGGLSRNIPGGYLSGRAGQTSQVMAPLDTRGSELHFVARPDGTFDHLMEFDQWGRLVRAVVTGAASQPLPALTACWPQSPGGVVVQLQGVPAKATELRIGFLAWAAGQIQVAYAGQTEAMNLPQGLHSAFLPVSGSADTVIITGMTARQLCIGDVEVGVLQPSPVGPAIPAIPALA